MLTKYLWVFFVSMVPLVELRGSIIISQGLQLPVLSSYIVAIIGNMLPVPVIYLFARKVLVWGADKPVIGKFFLGTAAAGACRWRYLYGSVYSY